MAKIPTSNDERFLQMLREIRDCREEVQTLTRHVLNMWDDLREEIGACMSINGEPPYIEDGPDYEGP